MPVQLLLNPHRFAAAGPDPLTFSGVANGGAWPSPWVTSAGNTGAVLDVQSGRGHQHSATAAYYAARAFYGTGTLTDFVRAGKLSSVSGSERYCNVIIRADDYVAGGDYPVNGYMLSMRPTAAEIKFIKVAASSPSEPASASYAFGGDVYWEITAAGSTFDFRVWDVGAGYPASPTLSTTDTAHASGKWGLSFSSNPGGLDVYWDDIVLGPHPDSLGGGGGAGGAALWSDGTPALWSDGAPVNWSSS